MADIFETHNFIVEAHPKPFVSRTDGGHIRIKVKDESIADRTKLTPSQAIELMRLTMIIGEAMEKGMNDVGIPVIKINYQDMGNWAYKENKLPFLHVHIFGRAKDSTKQPFPESVYLPDRSSGFYDGFEPLNEKDIESIKTEIDKLLKEPRFSDEQWKLY
jgi:diadenosine tetraphosphate (Ap4A) HIT family hydrolase